MAAQKTKDNILAAGLRLFSQKGFEGCSVDLIAEKAGVNKASIYYHFKDKATLYETILKKNLNRFLERLKQATASQDSADKKLEAFALTYAENFSSNKAMAPLMLRELAADGIHLTAQTRAVLKEIILEIDRILKKGQQAGIFRSTKTFLPYFMIVGSMNIFTSTQGMRKNFQGTNNAFGFAGSHEETASDIADLILHGLMK